MNAIFIKKSSARYRVLKKTKVEAESDGMFRVARRCHGIMLSMDLHTAPAIAGILLVTRAQVSKWIRDYLQDGIDSVYEGYRAGAPSKISEKQRNELFTIIADGPIKHGLQTGIWSSVNVSEVIRRKFAITYHPGHVRKLLHKIGCSVQRPKSRNYKADPIKHAEWQEKTYPAVKKKRWFRMPSSSLKTKPHLN